MNVDDLETMVDTLSCIADALWEIDPKENPTELYQQLKLLNSVTTQLLEEQKRILDIAQTAILEQIK